MEEFGSDSHLPINSLSIPDVAPNIEVDGPVSGLDDEVKELHRLALQQAK